MTIRCPACNFKSYRLMIVRGVAFRQCMNCYVNYGWGLKPEKTEKKKNNENKKGDKNGNK